MTKNTTKTSRVTNVQVPGEQPKIDLPAEIVNAGAAGTDAADTANSGGTPPAAAKPEFSEADLEALRAQIRNEERAKARAELGQQIEAAASVVAKPDASAAAPRSKADYRNMRAADIDPATLTAPVMTRDGYLCPPAPEAKK